MLKKKIKQRKIYYIKRRKKVGGAYTWPIDRLIIPYRVLQQTKTKVVIQTGLKNPVKETKCLEMNTHPQSNKPNMGHKIKLQKKTMCNRLQTSIPTRDKFEHWTHLFEGQQLKLTVNKVTFKLFVQILPNSIVITKSVYYKNPFPYLNFLEGCTIEDHMLN